MAACRWTPELGAAIVDIAWAYTAIGAVVAALFLIVGIGRVSPGAVGSYVFRPLLVPGIVLLWPAVLWRWWQLERGAGWTGAAHRPPRRVQSGVAALLIVLIPVIIFGALLIRQDGPHHAAPVRLDAPAGEATQ